MKRIFKAILEAVRVVVGFTGFVLCFFEAPDLTTQFYVSLVGMALMIITVLPTILREWRASWRTS